MATIGDRIKEKRKELNLTQVQLAEKLNVTDRAVSKWEQNDGNPDFSLLSNLAEVLGVSLDYLISGKEVAVNLDDMDEEKRMEYLIKKDDVQNYKKYCEVDGRFLMYAKYFHQDRILYDLENKARIVRDTIYINKSKNIFNLLLDDFIKSYKRINQHAAVVSFFDEQLDNVIQMACLCDRLDFIQLLNIKYLEIGKTKIEFEKKIYRISVETLECLLDKNKGSKKIAEYASTMASYNNTDKCRNNMNEDILCCLYQLHEYDMLNNCIGQLEEILKKLIKYDFEYRKRGYSFTYNTYNTWNKNNVYSVICDNDHNLIQEIGLIKKALVLAMDNGDFKWARIFNKYNQKVCEYFGTNDYIKEEEMNIKEKLADKNVSEDDKIMLRCVKDQIININEVFKISDVKKAKSIINSYYYNYMEIVLDGIFNKKQKILYKFFVDHNMDRCSEILSTNGRILDLLKMCYELFMLGIGDSQYNDMKSNNNSVNPNILAEFNKKYGSLQYCKSIEEYEKLLLLFKAQKEYLCNRIDELAEKRIQLQKIQTNREAAVNIVSRKEVDELLINNKDMCIIKVCSLLENILKYDYFCESEDLHGKMKEFFDKMPEEDSKKGGIFANLFNKKKVSTSTKRELLNRLRMQRNNIAHSESNYVKELSKDELIECIDYIFSLKKGD